MALVVLSKGIVSSIRLKVPLRVLERTRKKSFAAERKLQIEGLKILVVEDSSLSFALTSTMIKHITGTISNRARDGQEAVTMMQREEYDLVFMDQLMPVMSGIEATRAIRQILPANRQPFIIGLSGAATPHDIDACMEAGMDHFLAKPLRFAQMEQTLAFAVGNATAIDELIEERII